MAKAYPKIENYEEHNERRDKVENDEEGSPLLETIGRRIPTTKKILRVARGRFAKGQSANPGGMPPGTPSLVRLLKDRLARYPSEAADIVDAVIRLAKMGDMRAIELLWDRVDGKVVEKHLIEGERPVTIQFVPAQRVIEYKPVEIESKPVLELEEGDKKDGHYGT